jgi:hypothetical protein
MTNRFKVELTCARSGLRALLESATDDCNVEVIQALADGDGHAGALATGPAVSPHGAADRQDTTCDHLDLVEECLRRGDKLDSWDKETFLPSIGRRLLDGRPLTSKQGATLLAIARKAGVIN